MSQPIPLLTSVRNAESAGWAGLRVECGICAASTRVGPIFLSWVRLKQRSRRRLPARLEDVAAILFCATCGRQPSSIALWKASDDPGNPTLLPLAAPPPRSRRRGWVSEREAARVIAKDRRD